MRIYDNPSHPYYGPVRRMWVILAQLNLLETAEAAAPAWDRRIATMIDEGNPESAAQRSCLRVVLAVHP